MAFNSYIAESLSNLMGLYGTAVSYKPAGGVSQDIYITLEYAGNMGGDHFQVQSQQAFAMVQKTDIVQPKAGDTFTLAGDTWRVVDVQRGNDYLWQCLVEKYQ